MKKSFFICMSIIAVIFLTACTNGQSKESTKQLIIPNASHFEHVYIQGVNKEGVMTSSTYKSSDNVPLVKDIIKLVDRVVVKKPKQDKDLKAIRQIRQNGNYILAFGDTKDWTGDTYSIYLLKDGTMYYQDILGSTDMTFISTEKHKDIVEQIKKKLNVTF